MYQLIALKKRGAFLIRYEDMICFSTKTELNPVTVTQADLNTTILKIKNGANGMTMTDMTLESILKTRRKNEHRSNV